jgi:hypothetical protein
MPGEIKQTGAAIDASKKKTDEIQDKIPKVDKQINSELDNTE